MVDPYYFEIPVYRCDLETHTKEMKVKEEGFEIDEYKLTAPESYRNLLNHFHRVIWYPWKYNEIIGWVCLYILGNQIRADYYFITSQRIGKGIRKKKFVHSGKAFEHSLERRLSSNEILKEILIKLDGLNKEAPFKNRYIDIESFKIIGEFLAWEKLVDKLNSFKYPKSN